MRGLASLVNSLLFGTDAGSAKLAPRIQPYKHDPTFAFSWNVL